MYEFHVSDDDGIGAALRIDCEEALLAARLWAYERDALPGTYEVTVERIELCDGHRVIADACRVRVDVTRLDTGEWRHRSELVEVEL
jgi:hypothetical protein